jgi:hypothetical protein
VRGQQAAGAVEIVKRNEKRVIRTRVENAREPPLVCGLLTRLAAIEVTRSPRLQFRQKNRFSGGLLISPGGLED